MAPVPHISSGHVVVMVPAVREIPVVANPFVHVEDHTTDLARAREFYTGLFGWKLQDVPTPGNGSYTMIDVGGGTGGRMMAAQRPGEPSHWMRLCRRRRHPRLDEEGLDARSEGGHGCRRGRPVRLEEHDHGPDRCDDRPLAGQAPPITPQRIRDARRRISSWRVDDDDARRGVVALPCQIAGG